MNLNKLAKSEGISNIQYFSEFEFNKLCTNVAKKLEPLFKDYNLNTEHLFNVFKTLNVYSADFVEKNISAKYHYQSNTIFINNNSDLSYPDTVILHECLHFLQSEIENNKVIRMGLYNVKSYRNKGLGLNEAAVQTIAAQMSNIKPSSLRYFDLNFTTPSPDHYPLETALLRQMSYFTGTYPLFFSTIFSTNLFKDVFSSITSKKLYEEISSDFNKLIQLQDSFLKTQNNNSDEEEKENIKNMFKRDIQWIVSKIQNNIYQNAFNKQFKNIQNKQDIQNFRTSLLNFNNYIIEIPGSNSFQQYRDSMTSKLMLLETELEEKGYIKTHNINMSLSPISNYTFRYLRVLFNKLKLNTEIMFRVRQKEEDYY